MVIVGGKWYGMRECVYWYANEVYGFSQLQVISHPHTHTHSHTCTHTHTHARTHTHTHTQARILYDFEGDTENGELVIGEGDVVTVLNQVRVWRVHWVSSTLHARYTCSLLVQYNR